MTDLPHISQAIAEIDGTPSYEMRGWMELVESKIAELEMVKDYFVEVARGNVPGQSTRGVTFRNSLVGTSFEDIWGGSADLVYPTSAESWEVASDNANDILGGTGAETVLINYLDDEYAEQSIVVNLNGVTAVPLNADHFRPNGAVIISSGSSKTNSGTIRVRVSGAGPERQVIMPGVSASEDCHFTVPAGKTAYALNVTPFYPKNEDGFVSGRVMPFGTNTEISTGSFPFYQDTFAIVFKALFPLQEKTDLKFKANSSNIGVNVNMVFEVLLVDNP